MNSKDQDMEKILALVNEIQCATGQQKIYFFSHHSIISYAINFFKNTPDVIVVDVSNGNQYQRGNALPCQLNYSEIFDIKYSETDNRYSDELPSAMII
jgi:predicted amino acid racemase